MKKPPALVLYLAAAALLGGYIYFFERGPVPTKKEEEKTKLFKDFVADDIQGIKLENLSTTVTAFKTPIVIDKDSKGIWRMTSPRQVLADESNVRSLLTQVGDVVPDDSIAKPVTLSDFGLDQPGARCTFTRKSGPPLVLEVGDRNKALSSVYAQTQAKDKVYVLSAGVADNIFKDVNYYRDHTFFKPDTVSARKIRVTYDKKVFVFEKNKDSSWTMTEPLGVKADTNKIQGLLNNITTLRIDQFVDEHPSSLKIYGLSQPHAKIEVWENNDKEPKTLELGRKKLKEGGYFAKMVGRPDVDLIGEFFDKSLDIHPDDYRDKNMLRFDASEAQTLEVARGKKSYTYQKDDKGNWISEGRPQAPTEAANIISSLATLTVASTAPKSADTGLASPSFKVKVTLKDKSIHFYSFGKKQKDEVYVTPGHGDVYLVATGLLSQMEAYFSVVLTPVPTALSVPPAKK